MLDCWHVFKDTQLHIVSNFLLLLAKSFGSLRLNWRLQRGVIFTGRFWELVLDHFGRLVPWRDKRVLVVHGEQVAALTAFLFIRANAHLSHHSIRLLVLLLVFAWRLARLRKNKWPTRLFVGAKQMVLWLIKLKLLLKVVPLLWWI